MYPLTWYDGPLFFTRENHRLLPTNKIGYGNLHPPGWLDLLLLEFERAGIGFFGEVYFRDLPVLRIQTDARPWRPGVLSTWDGMAGEAFHAELKHPAGASLFQLYRTGRRRTDWWGTQPLAPGRENIGPMYNPLHPVVRKAYLEVIGEALKRYGRYPAFKGLVLSLGKGWPLRAESLVFDRLDSDYSDLTLERFRTDTGTVVPAPGTTESDRAKERYDWIMRHARQPWIDWRCRKIEEIVGTVAGMVRSTRPELKLVLGLGLSPLPGELAEVRKGARLSEIYREHGLDLRRLAQIPNVVIERWQWDAQFNPADPSPTFIDYTDPETDFLVPNGPTAAANHYNYNETGARSYPGLWEGFSPAICYTITPERSFMRFFAESLARSDVGLLTAGGLGTPPTQGHADQIRPFAQAFRGLPDKPFIQGESVTDAVVLRYRVDEGETFVYLVNRDGYDGEVEVNFQSDFPVDVGELTRPERETVAPGERLKIKLRPYELRSFKIDRKVKPRMDQYHPDSETVETLTKCLAQLDVREPSGGVKELIRQARTALEQRHFHRARRLIDVEIPRRAAWEKWEARERAQITWQLIGPFPQTDLKGHDTVYEPEHDYLAGKEPAPSYRSAAGPVLTWKTVTGTFHSPLAKFGFVDLAEHLGRDEPPTNAVAYAFARIHSEKNLATVLRVYSDDGEKVWVNRCLVTKFGGDRDIEQGSESAVVNFHAGWNTLLVKIEQHTGGWGFIIDLDHRLKSR